MRVDGAVALVTGANRGLGRAFAQALLDAGAAKVYAGARNPESVEVTDPRLVPLRLDVTDPAQIKAAAEVASDVQIVVNNAGITRGGTPLVASGAVEGFQEELETNVFGPLRVTQAFAPILAANGGGTLVNMLSALSWWTVPTLAGYSATKAAAWSLTNATRVELAGQGTQVVAVHAGYIDTDMAAAVDAPKIKPEDVARQTVAAIEAGDVEVLADDTSTNLKAGLAGDLRALYALS